MRHTRHQTNSNADPTRWSRTGNDPARPKAGDRRENTLDVEPRERPAHHPSRPDEPQQRAAISTWGGIVPTIDTSASVKSP